METSYKTLIDIFLVDQFAYTKYMKQLFDALTPAQIIKLNEYSTEECLMPVNVPVDGNTNYLVLDGFLEVNDIN